MASEPLRYRVLTFDGGGIRGLMSLIWLERLLKVRPDLLHKIDLIAGTSTGGIIALCLAHEVPLDQIRLLYELQGKRIFERTWKYLGGLRGPRYKNHNLTSILGDRLGRVSLGELAYHVLIPTFDLCGMVGSRQTWKPKFYTNLDQQDRAVPAWKVALYTSAAPTYFPQVDGHIDGGVVANNPSMCAVAQVLNGGLVRLNEIELLSIGTGQQSKFIRSHRFQFGATDIGTLLDIVFDGLEMVTHYQCQQLLKDNYCRVNPPLPVEPPLNLDDVDAIAEMVVLAKTAPLTWAENWLQTHWS